MTTTDRLALLLALLALTGTLSLRADEIPPPPGVRVYEAGMAPAFELADIDGEPFALADSAGRWRMVHFWASWCGPCREEMPAIQRMASRMQDQPLVIVMVNTAEDEDTIFTFLAALAPGLNSLMDRDGQVTEAWQPRGLPATYLVDPGGAIRYQALGGRPWDQPQYLEFLRALVAQPAP